MIKKVIKRQSIRNSRFFTKNKKKLNHVKKKYIYKQGQINRQNLKVWNFLKYFIALKNIPSNKKIWGGERGAIYLNF